MSKLSHIDADNKPTMVDVSDKQETLREAHAQAVVRLPDAIVRQLSDVDNASNHTASNDIASKKGPVFSTAVIAGVMAAKKTHELIPFCHPIGLDDCSISIRMHDSNAVVDCHCKVRHKTGVEMEALTGASVAALTIYDMLKALSHDIVIGDTRLMAKTGGKQDFRRDK